MYQPAKYTKTDSSYIYNFIQEHPFATFVLQGNKLLATHIPVLLQGSPRRFQLYGHIANHNPQYQYLADGIEALLIFTGPHAYVSSSWYKEKNISTWDYSAVHVNVKLKIQSRQELEESLEKLVGRFEKPQRCPLFYDALPRQMVEEHLEQITGFWCEPLQVQVIAKLHQGFDKEDIRSVTQHLEEEEGNPLAQEVSRQLKKEHDTGN